MKSMTYAAGSNPLATKHLAYRCTLGAAQRKVSLRAAMDRVFGSDSHCALIGGPIVRPFAEYSGQELYSGRNTKSKRKEPGEA